MIHFNILSIFPGFFDSPLKTGLLGKSVKNGLLSVTFRNPRDYASSKHKHLDDYPYGGGPGMIMQADPLARALRSLPNPGKIILLSPSGRPMDGELASELSKEPALTLICGRYEGIDARLGEEFNLEEIAVGEAIMNGGETPALAVMESVARFLPGFLGKLESTDDESLSEGLVEYPQYTRPQIWENHAIPELLKSGDHKRIASWRRTAALTKTARMRPELLNICPINEKDANALKNLHLPKTGSRLSFCLVHHPVKLENDRIGTSSLTNLDIHDIARISRSYGMGPFYVITPLNDQRILLKRIVDHWLGIPMRDRAKALSMVYPAHDLEEVLHKEKEVYGIEPVVIGTSAAWPCGKHAPHLITPRQALDQCKCKPTIILLGTARGLSNKILESCDFLLRPLRFLNENHLSVRSAAAIIADRILGDFN